MALVQGNTTFGAPGLSFGELGGTFGNLWANGNPEVSASVSGGGTVTAEPAAVYDLWSVSASGNGGATVVLDRVIKYTGTPNRVLQAGGSGPTLAALREPT